MVVVLHACKTLKAPRPIGSDCTEMCSRVLAPLSRDSYYKNRRQQQQQLIARCVLCSLYDEGGLYRLQQSTHTMVVGAGDGLDKLAVACLAPRIRTPVDFLAVFHFVSSIRWHFDKTSCCAAYLKYKTIFVLQILYVRAAYYGPWCPAWRHVYKSAMA